MRIHLTTVVIVIILCLLGAALPGLAQEESGTWRGRWWNYYERGLEKGEAGDWSGAMTDFSKAMKLREKDQRRARTYGMHFIDYFPHRELGVACYHSGDLDRALKELEVSYASAESAKAAFYLNAVRRDLLKQKGAPLQRPEITILSPRPGQFHRETSIAVSGAVSAPAKVASLLINGVPYRFDVARDRLEFSSEVALEDDDMVITVEACDLLGNTTRTEIPIKIDREGPSLSLTAISRTPDDPNKVHIQASVADVVGIKSLLVNGTTISTGDAKDMVLDTVIVLAAGTSAIHIETQDLIGNDTAVDLNPDQEHAAMLHSRPRTLVAFNSLAGIFSRDKEPPVITLKDVDDVSAVYIDRYYVEGEALDNSKVGRITINGREIQLAKGKKVFFNKIVRLKEGNNTITVEAYDSAGNRRVAGFNVTRIIPSARQLSARMTVSVLPFAPQGTRSYNAMLEDLLVDALQDQKRFQLVERKYLNQILREQKLTKENLADPEHSIQIGRLQSADAVLATSILETATSVEITARMVSSETAEVMDTKDVYTENKSAQSVKEMLEGLACKLTRAFPVVEGKVLKREKGTIVTNLGEASGVRRPMVAAIFRRTKEIRDPKGKSLGYDMVKIGEGTINEVQHDFSKINLRNRSMKKGVNVDDIVFTR